MDRNQLAQEMVDKLKGQGQELYLTEVATPGARPDAVRKPDIDHFNDER